MKSIKMNICFVFAIFFLIVGNLTAIRLSSKNNSKKMNLYEPSDENAGVDEVLEKLLKEMNNGDYLNKTDSRDSSEENLENNLAFDYLHNKLTNVIADFTLNSLKYNPEGNFNNDDVEKALINNGFASLIQSSHRQRFFDSLKKAFNKAKEFAKKSWKKLKKIGLSAFSDLKKILIKYLGPAMKKVLNDFGEKFLPKAEQIVADSIKKIKPDYQQLLTIPVANIFNRIEKILGVNITDDVFKPKSVGGIRLVPDDEDSDDYLLPNNNSTSDDTNNTDENSNGSSTNNATEFITKNYSKNNEDKKNNNEEDEKNIEDGIKQDWIEALNSIKKSNQQGN